jgi:outer membrane protein OmpA-like peptidoglycan-associated protein
MEVKAMRSLSLTAILGVAALVLAGTTGPRHAEAQTMSLDQFETDLQKPKTRSFDPDAPKREAAEKKLQNTLRSFDGTRGIVPEARTEVTKLIKESEAPNVDVQILFAFDSDEILPEAKPDLDVLGKGFNGDKLKSVSFLIAGHTDAKGSDDYNLDLSQRRANSVKAYLIDIYHVDPSRLATIGFGEEQLKNKEDPLADENRRVQIVNVGSGAVAEAKPAESKPAQ